MIVISCNHRGKLLIVLLAVCHLLASSCSRKIYPGPSFSNIGGREEMKEMEAFMAQGVEKSLSTHHVTPEMIIETAVKYLGVPHCMGGRTMKCMDCSGLLVTVFATHGIQLPHNSEEQARYGKIIAAAGELKRGDLVFFIRSYKTTNFITHAGIYVGDDKFIHASTSNGVTITSIHDPWWNERYLFGTRLFR